MLPVETQSGKCILQHGDLPAEEEVLCLVKSSSDYTVMRGGVSREGRRARGSSVLVV